ncbi:MAG: apolipoprotein N-acyltransferase [Alphaproteobacteria bacterium]
MSLFSAIGRLAARVRSLGRGRQAILALGLGGLAATAFPPLDAVPLYAVGLTGLVWLLESGNARRAAATGWLYGVGHFGVGLHWVAYALLTDPGRYGWMVPFAVLGLAAGLAIFVAGAAFLARWLAPQGGTGLVLALGAAWGLAEWLRGHVLTGFPWILAAHVWDFDPVPLQAASVVGTYGLSLATAWIGAAPALLGCKTMLSGHARRGVFATLAAAVAILSIIWVGGSLRLMTAQDRFVPGVMLRIVQPNIAQTHKWVAALRQSHFQRHLDLSRDARSDGITHVIWPETATPFALGEEPDRRAIMRDVVPGGGALITGTLRVEGRGPSFRVWNALQGIDSNGTIVGTYDKAHLVPFGEYMPLRQWLDIAKITPGSTDFSAGPGPRTLRFPGLPPTSPLICYEVIFPGAVVDPADRPAWLLNVTNDAWFGLSPGPYQHLAAARLRTVEEGLPLVRAANTGISAVIDPYGRFAGRLGLGEAGVLDQRLPDALASPPPYARLGDSPFALAAGLTLGLVGWARFRGRATRS